MSRRNDNNYIPKDYTDLYLHYIVGDGHGNSLADKLIRSFLPYATPDEKEHLSHDIFLRIREHNMLERFDPAKANFGGVIFFVTRTVCSNHLARKSRNPLTGLNAGSIVETDPEDTIFEPGVYSLDRIFGTVQPDLEGAMDARDIIAELFSWAKAKFDNPAHKRDASLYPLLQLLVDQHDPKECGEQLGVTPSTISNWLKVLRDQIIKIKAQYEPG